LRCLRAFFFLAFALLVLDGVELVPDEVEPEPVVTAGLEVPLVVVVEPGFVVLPVVVVPGRLPVVVVPPPPVVVVDPPPDPPEGGGVVVVPPGVVVVPPGVVVVPPGRGGRGSVTVVTPGTPTETSLLRALTLAFFVRLLQTAFLERFFFFLCFATTACESPLAELAAPEAANADAKPAVGVTSRASRQATARLYALGDIERAPFLRWGTGAPGCGPPTYPLASARRLERLSPL
jgi:hypothetical protein